VLVDQEMRSAYSSRTDAAAAARELVSGFGDIDAAAVMFFCSPALDGELIARDLAGAFPAAPVLGCTTAGEFTERGSATGGVAAVAIPTGVARRAVASLADLRHGVDEGVSAAISDIQRQLGVSLRDADPTRYVGFVLIDGLHGSEERVNEMLGNVAPLMSFVGGSAGDDLRFTKTKVFCGNASSEHGAALLVVDAAVAFTVVKTCSFQPAGRSFVITDADVSQRTVWEFDGRPAAQAYAEAVGCTVDELPEKAFMSHPLGLMIDGKPWIRSPQQVIEGRGVKFYCQILPGMEVDLMDSTDLVGDTRTALRQAVTDLGGEASGAVMFNCILRRLELDAKDLHQPFVQALGGIHTAGFHTYGESWLGHINQTLTAVLFGR
jgi:hypothetical protein